jgi:hypothetical protein
MDHYYHSLVDDTETYNIYECYINEGGWYDYCEIFDTPTHRNRKSKIIKISKYVPKYMHFLFLYSYAFSDE